MIDSCHLGSHRLGDLDGERPRSSSRAVDEDALSRLHLSHLDDALQRNERRLG